jgi:gluconate 2-dehydrogenase subunit 3-like protein
MLPAAPPCLVSFQTFPRAPGEAGSKARRRSCAIVRAKGSFRLLKEAEADIIEAIGDTLVQGARAAGVAHFIDHQISVPAEEALLQARIFNVRPPFANFYRAAVSAIDSSSRRAFGYKFTEATPDQQSEFAHNMRQNKVDGWQGPPAPFVYTILRTDAVDVVYGTMEGYELLGIPYQAHIVPEKRW